MSQYLPSFLPGQLKLERGGSRDYFELEKFHYVAKRPATWSQVWSVCYRDSINDGATHRGLIDDAPGSITAQDAAAKWRVVAVGVLSYPTPSCRARQRLFGLEHFTFRERLHWVNQNLRTISRVIVHPQFRSLGLASLLIKCLCANCDTRYVEALAQMGRRIHFLIAPGCSGSIRNRMMSRSILYGIDEKAHGNHR